MTPNTVRWGGSQEIRQPRPLVGAITTISFGTQIGQNMINDVKSGTGLTRQRRQRENACEKGLRLCLSLSMSLLSRADDNSPLWPTIQ